MYCVMPQVPKMTEEETTTSLDRLIIADFQKESDVLNVPSDSSQIAGFYKNKNVFVTGATGFLGKLLVEKLLRACPDIETVSILVRPKKGEDAYSRVDKLYSDVVFEPLRRAQPKFQHKINVVRGDAALPGLGINADDQQFLIEKVNVIFHIAATVKFDEKINLATAINVRSTRDLLALAKTCKNLQSFLYVGTAYSNCNRTEIGECFYDTPISASDLIDLAENTPEKALLGNTEKILAGWPNTYVFTKAISEDAVRQYDGDSLPVCVFRPAIVISTYKEPIKSWTDNLYGAVGISVGAGVGLLKSIHCHEDKSAEVVPADYVINGMIAASYKTAMDKPEKIPVYNYVSSVQNRITWKRYMELNQKYGLIIPTMKSVWYYCLTLNRSKYVHFLYVLLLQYLPALVMDAGLVIIGKKPMMFNVYKKITKFESVLSFFATNEWEYGNKNIQNLWKELPEPDQKLFGFNIKDVDWEKFYSTYLVGVRLFLLKDDHSTLPQAKRKWMLFYIAHQAIKSAFYMVLLWVAYVILRRLFA